MPHPQSTQSSTRGFGDIKLPDVPDSFYAEAKASNPYKCTEEEWARFRTTISIDAAHRLCENDDYV